MARHGTVMNVYGTPWPTHEPPWTNYHSIGMGRHGIAIVCRGIPWQHTDGIDIGFRGNAMRMPYICRALPWHYHGPFRVNARGQYQGNAMMYFMVRHPTD